MRHYVSLLLSAALSFYPLHAFPAESTGTATSTTFTEAPYTSAYIPNPHKSRMFYIGSDIINSYESASVTNGINAGWRLFGCRVNLASFRTTNLDSTFLTTLQSRLDSIRAAGGKCVMWFYYDFSSAGNDASASQIVAHLQQLKPYFLANADVIAFVKAGFVGAWGEWHSSASGTTASTATLAPIRDALLDALHPYTPIQSRYPGDIRTWYPTPAGESVAFSGSPQSRWGSHDDCQLSAYSGDTLGNTGTYIIRTGGATPATLRSYLDSATNYVSYGGEISNSCQTPFRLTCAEARTDFARFHISYLKTDSDSTNWTSSWSAGGCANELYNRIGYYFVLNGVTHQSTVTRGDSITVRVDITNQGYSRLHAPYRLVAKACLVASPNTCYTGTASTTLRQLPPQATTSTRVAVPITIPVGATTGSYKIRISAPDIWPNTASVRAFAIRFANTNDANGSWSDATGYWSVDGTILTVNP